MYLESVTSDQKLAPCPCPPRPNPSAIPQGKTRYTRSSATVRGKEVFTASQTMSAHNIQLKQNLLFTQNKTQASGILFSVP